MTATAPTVDLMAQDVTGQKKLKVGAVSGATTVRELVQSVLGKMRLVREDPEFKDLPVVVVSILDEDHELVHDARRHGIQGILRKPVKHLDLVAVLAGIMSRSA